VIKVREEGILMRPAINLGIEDKSPNFPWKEFVEKLAVADSPPVKKQ